jgi:hypothetical protein
MEVIRNTVSNTPVKKQEVIGEHANKIVTLGISSEREVNKRMDALCMKEDFAKGIL